jgi:hypothetical protein
MDLSSPFGYGTAEYFHRKNKYDADDDSITCRFREWSATMYKDNPHEVSNLE